MATGEQYRWVIVMYHAGEEESRIEGDKWFDSKEECLEDAKSLDFDYCCGYEVTYEVRPTPGDRMTTKQALSIMLTFSVLAKEDKDKAHDLLEQWVNKLDECEDDKKELLQAGHAFISSEAEEAKGVHDEA